MPCGRPARSQHLVATPRAPLPRRPTAKARRWCTRRCSSASPCTGGAAPPGLRGLKMQHLRGLCAMRPRSSKTWHSPPSRPLRRRTSRTCATVQTWWRDRRHVQQPGAAMWHPQHRQPSTHTQRRARRALGAASRRGRTPQRGQAWLHRFGTLYSAPLSPLPGQMRAQWSLKLPFLTAQTTGSPHTWLSGKLYRLWHLSFTGRRLAQRRPLPLPTLQQPQLPRP